MFLICIRDICKPRPATFNFLYLDNIAVGATAATAEKVVAILEKTAKAMLLEAKESAIEFKVSKTELLFASKKRTAEKEEKTLLIRNKIGNIRDP